MPESTESQPESIPTSPPPPERRERERHPFRLRTFCHPRGGGASQWARVREVSLTGIGLFVSHPFAAGERVTVELRGKGQGNTHFLVAEVMHAHPQQDGNWLLG
ncbi:MAG: PilZ domain-containing protein, partial [Gemmataceae bacterium]|nr:PilZ domain-containing protein [Gemmataceae bacterium]